MGILTAVTSNKGGVGKSTAALGLAAASALRGYRTLLLDLDAGSRCADLYMGVQDELLYSYRDVTGGLPLDKAVYVNRNRATGGEFLHLLSSPPEGEDHAPGALTAFLAEAKKHYDYIWADCPPGLFAGFDELCANAGRALVVCLHTAASIRTAGRTAALIHQMGVGDIRLLINGFRPAGVTGGPKMGIVDMIESVKVRLAGVIEQDERIRELQESGKTVFDAQIKKHTDSFNGILDRLEGANVNLPPKLAGVKTGKLHFHTKR